MAGGTVRDHLERLMPSAGRQRRLVGWGVVAWTAIGGIVLLWVVLRILARVSGIFPYLVMAAVVVFALEPGVRRLAALGAPRRLAATVVFAAAVVLAAVIVSLLVPTLIRQATNLTGSSPALVRKGGGAFANLSRSTNPPLHALGTTVSS